MSHTINLSVFISNFLIMLEWIFSELLMELLETGKSDLVGIDILHFHSTLATFCKPQSLKRKFNNEYILDSDLAIQGLKITIMFTHYHYH